MEVVEREGAQVALWMRIVGKIGGQGVARGLVRGLDLGEGDRRAILGDGGLPWCPVAKTLQSQCREPGLDPWSGTRSHMSQPRQCSQIHKKYF